MAEDRTRPRRRQAEGTQPVEVVGPLSAELVVVATDAADTDFMVKLVDVYPNGYEAIVNDGAFRLRYVDGFDKQTRIQSGKAYTISVNLWSTALVFSIGHKIAVHVSSSNFPRFERTRTRGSRFPRTISR